MPHTVEMTMRHLAPGMRFMEYGRTLKVIKFYPLGEDEVVVHDDSGMVRSLHADTPVTVVLKKRK